MHRTIHTALVATGLTGLFVLAIACGPEAEETTFSEQTSLGALTVQAPSIAPECPVHDPPDSGGAARAFLSQGTQGDIGSMLLLDKQNAFSVQDVEVCGGEGPISYRGVPVRVWGCKGKGCVGVLYMFEADFERYHDDLDPHWDIWVIANHNDPAVGGRCDNVPEGLGINCKAASIDEITVKSIDP